MAHLVDTVAHGVETSNPTVWLIADCLGPWSQRHPGRIGSHPRVTNPFIPLHLRRTGAKTVPPGVDTGPHGVGAPKPLADR